MIHSYRFDSAALDRLIMPFTRIFIVPPRAQLPAEGDGVLFYELEHDRRAIVTGEVTSVQLFTIVSNTLKLHGHDWITLGPSSSANIAAGAGFNSWLEFRDDVLSLSGLNHYSGHLVTFIRKACEVSA